MKIEANATQSSLTNIPFRNYRIVAKISETQLASLNDAKTSKTNEEAGAGPATARSRLALSKDSASTSSAVVGNVNPLAQLAESFGLIQDDDEDEIDEKLEAKTLSHHCANQNLTAARSIERKSSNVGNILVVQDDQRGTRGGAAQGKKTDLRTDLATERQSSEQVDDFPEKFEQVKDEIKRNKQRQF